ncbi:MAG TPA: 4-hydroxyphenylacetate 3-hydroxylase N-terminal domain-containing protein [Candidatus Binataceae bacterium]|nr:4-hydroxyphenylacetate 3-hydroxylase N-terminal domain-containing protein [Candidatus Binataceae bacterium]
MSAKARSASVESPPQVLPFTGAEYLESLKDDREVYIYGERVADLTKHPAFRNSARMLARMYDALHDPARREVLTVPTDTGNGGFTHRFYRADRSAEECVKTRDAIAAWQRLTWGWMGRSPDYKASFLGTLGANSQFYAPYHENAQAWYRRAQERCLYMNHALINPPVDKSRPLTEASDVYVHAEKETDAGLIVSGAKVVATNSALTHHNFIGCYQIGRPEQAILAMLPMNAPGLKLICRTSYEMTAAVMGSPFDYPLSSRLDENDAILILDQVLIPWENVFLYRDLERANLFFAASGFLNRFSFHGCTRLAVKLDFLVGLTLLASEVAGVKDKAFGKMQLGEMLALRHLIWALSEAMARNPDSWVNGTVLPNMSYANAYRVLSPVVYARIREIIQQIISSGLIYLNSHVADFRNPEIRALLDKYLRGSYGQDAVERVKIMKLLWDSVGTEFGGRHELYERNYAGNYEHIRAEALLVASADGCTETLKQFARSCMDEYDLDGWRTPDLVDAADVSFLKH